MIRLLPGLALALALLTGATARAQSTINDCEKIQAADAYNQCLAKFGPASKSQNIEPEKPGDFKASSADAAASAGPAKGRGGRHVSRRRGGGHAVSHGGNRKRMSIQVHRRRR